MELISFAPIFDNGNSMMWTAKSINSHEFLNLKTESKGIYSTQYDLLHSQRKNLDYLNSFGFDNLPDEKEVFEFYCKYDIPVEISATIANAYGYKKSIFNEFVKGKSLYIY